MRYLIRTKVEYDDTDGFWSLIPETGEPTFTFKATDSQMRLFLLRIKAKDELMEPRSYRSLLYREIVALIKNNEECWIHIWNFKFPKRDTIQRMLSNDY